MDVTLQPWLFVRDFAMDHNQPRWMLAEECDPGYNRCHWCK